MERRLRRVLEYIELHLDEELTLASLSSLAALSEFHFHRLFSAILGAGVSRYVQLLRMKRATYQLAYRRQLSVLSIALASGYAGPEAFARALRRLVGQSPSEFRDQPDWEALHVALKPINDVRTRNMNASFTVGEVRVVDFPTTAVALLAHRGDPHRLGESIRKFIEWRVQQRLPPRTNATFNLCYDDPNECEAHSFRMDLCVATDREVVPNEMGVVAGAIPGGRCAVLRVVGPDELVESAARFLYAQWLPRSGEEPRDFPLFLQRVAFFPEVLEGRAVTDVYLPLQGRKFA